MVFSELLPLLHPVNPYEGFELSQYQLDLQGWYGDDPVLAATMQELKPRLIIEVGTWKGLSAISMGKQLRSHGVDTCIVCVDTWLGATDFVSASDMRNLNRRNGYPQIYYQFLANVMYSGMENTIIPFPQTSINAARWFRQRGIKADFIYIDGSHEEGDVYSDIAAYYDLLVPNGIMLGDDYSVDIFPGLVNDVNRFTKERNIQFNVLQNSLGVPHFWMLAKVSD